jgi:hypothetical protein
MKGSPMLKQGISIFLVIAVLLAAALGCAGIVKLQPEERGAGASMIEDLSTKWESYTIYAAIWPGRKTVALLFDLRSDHGAILADGWTKVDAFADLASAMGWLQAGQSPRLFQVLGPDGHLFGYLYTALPGLQTQVVDAKTVRFYPVKPPPSPGP